MVSWMTEEGSCKRPSHREQDTAKRCQLMQTAGGCCGGGGGGGYHAEEACWFVLPDECNGSSFGETIICAVCHWTAEKVF